MHSRIFYSYEMDVSICLLGPSCFIYVYKLYYVYNLYFIFKEIYQYAYANGTDSDQTPRSVASILIQQRLPMSH